MGENNHPLLTNWADRIRDLLPSTPLSKLSSELFSQDERKLLWREEGLQTGHGGFFIITSRLYGVEERISTSLRNGELVATGIEQPISLKKRPAKIGAELWSKLKIDFDNDRATFGALELLDIRVSPAEPDHSVTPKRTRPSEAKVRSWYAQRAETLRATGETTNREKDEAAWNEDFGPPVNRQLLTNLRGETPGICRRPGRPRKI